MSERMAEPKFHINQVLRCLHTWAVTHPPRPVANVQWDGCWDCYTYAFPWSAIRIEEHQLEATGEQDISPEAWIEAALTGGPR